MNLIKALYTDTCNCVLADGITSDWFQVDCGVRRGCRIAADLFAVSMDWLMERTVHRGCCGCALSEEVFTDLDFADDIALLAEMLEVLLLALVVINEEAAPLGLRAYKSTDLRRRYSRLAIHLALRMQLLYATQMWNL